jgi:hypothetical protein
VLTLLRRVAEPLALAHSKGVLHRDLKPSNLFLRDGRIEQAVLLDFGVARQLDGPHSITATGMLIGTPDYMTPEQARGERTLSASVDIFSLGCVAYRCLVGAPPFGGQHISAMMAKLLSDEVPPLSALRPDVPPPLVNLLMRMLSRSPGLRPADGGALLAELAGLRDIADVDSPTLPLPAAIPLQLFRNEERLVSVVISSPQATGIRAGTTADVAGSVDDQYLQRLTLRQRLAELQAHVEFLADGSIVAFFSEPTVAEDIALQAVRCALLIRQMCDIPFVAVATGSGQMQLHRPMGEAIDRVAEFFHMLELDPATPSLLSTGSIVVDEITAGLVSPHFACVAVRPGLFVLDALSLRSAGQRSVPQQIRPCIGRDRELDLLMASLNESEQESISRVALFLGDAGIGKTRLLHAFLDRAGERGAGAGRILAHAAAFSSESGEPYSLLRQLLLHMHKQHVHDTEEAALARLQQRVDRFVAPAHRQETLRVLAQVCHLRPSTHALIYRSAGNEALAHDPVSLAFLRFLGSLCAEHSIVLALDNLQWADATSLRLIELALRALASMPLFVIGLARIDVTRRFPRLWSEHRLQEVHLQPLSPSDCAALVRTALPHPATDSELQRMSELSMGNPRYLEELLRAHVAGETAEIPGTLLAMLQGRLMALPADARSLLRMASVFEGSFSFYALSHLVQADITPSEVERLLHLLCDLSLLQQERRLPDETRVYRFRETVIRQAARSMSKLEDLRRAERALLAFLKSQPAHGRRAGSQSG